MTNTYLDALYYTMYFLTRVYLYLKTIDINVP